MTYGHVCRSATAKLSVYPGEVTALVLLYAVGAAVIGGTSLFGGKGRLVDAVIGGAMVAVIDNGMVDALSRRRAAATGTR